MPNSAVVLKVPIGTKAPSGYVFEKTLPSKGVNLYHKKVSKNAPKSLIKKEVDDLSMLFDGMNIVAEIDIVDDLGASLAAVALGGKRRRNTRGANRKNHKLTRRRRA